MICCYIVGTVPSPVNPLIDTLLHQVMTCKRETFKLSTILDLEQANFNWSGH